MVCRSATLRGVPDTAVSARGAVKDVISISVFLYDRFRVGDIVAISVETKAQPRPAILENVIYRQMEIVYRV
jgi:hypothetical protein